MKKSETPSQSRRHTVQYSIKRRASFQYFVSKAYYDRLRTFQTLTDGRNAQHDSWFNAMLRMACLSPWRRPTSDEYQKLCRGQALFQVWVESTDYAPTFSRLEHWPLHFLFSMPAPRSRGKNGRMGPAPSNRGVRVAATVVSRACHIV